MTNIQFKKENFLSKAFLVLLAIILFTSTISSQAQFWCDDFEGSPTSGTRTPEENGGVGVPPMTSYFRLTDGNSVSQSVAFTGKQGTNYWAGEDHNAFGNAVGQPPSSPLNEYQIEWTGINITGKTGLSFRGLFAANSTDGPFETAFSCIGPPSTNTDYIIVEYKLDAGTYNPLIRFYPKGTTTSGGVRYLFEDTNSDNCGDGTQLTTSFAEFIKSIPGTGITLNLKLRVFSEGNNEEWGIDNFRIFETVSSQEIDISGNNQNIPDGDTSPSLGDNTDFGSTYHQSGSITKTFKIKNIGTSNLTIGTISFSGGNASSDFSVTSPPSATVAAGDSTTLGVTFNPSAAGSRSTTINIVNNDGNENPFDFLIQGTGINSTTNVALTVPPTLPLNSVANISALLTTTAPVPGPLSSQTVIFTLTDPNATVTTNSVVTDAMGVANYTPTLNLVGLHTISATFNSAGGYETSTATAQTITVYAPVVLTCPTNTFEPQCQTQAAINLAFSAWLATATGSGGCNGVLTNNNPVPPSACGGSTTVTFTYESSCAPLTTTCQSTFTVIAPPTVSLSCPMDATISGSSQMDVNTQFANWLATASASGGCSGQLTNNNMGAPPVSGGSTPVIFTYDNNCAPMSSTCQATFTVQAGLYQNVQTNTSYTTLQAAINAATPGQTIKLLDNLSEANVTVTNSVSIDPNGFTLTIPSGNLTIPSGNYLIWPSSTLIITAPAQISNNGTIINNGTINYHGATGTFTNVGTYKGTGTFNGEFINNGIVTPGY